MNNFATVKKQNCWKIHRSPCRVSHVTAPLHSLTSSFAILLNRVAPPNTLPTHLATRLSALARRMCQGSSFSGREPVPAATELMAEAAPLQLITLSCFFCPLPLSSPFERRGQSKITSPTRFSPFPGFGRSRKMVAPRRKVRQLQSLSELVAKEVCAFFILFNSFRCRHQALGSLRCATKKKKPPICHQLPHVIRVLTKTTSCSSATPEKKTRLRRSRVDDRTLPGSGRTSLTGCRTTAVLTVSVCTRGHDPDAEPNSFSSMFLLGMWWCSDCDVTLGSLCGGVQKFVIWTTRASQSCPSINRNICSSTRAERRQVAEKAQVDAPTHQAPQRCIDRVLPMSMPYRAMHKNSWASITLRQHT